MFIYDNIDESSYQVTIGHKDSANKHVFSIFFLTPGSTKTDKLFTDSTRIELSSSQTPIAYGEDDDNLIFLFLTPIQIPYKIDLQPGRLYQINKFYNIKLIEGFKEGNAQFDNMSETTNAPAWTLDKLEALDTTGMTCTLIAEGSGRSFYTDTPSQTLQGAFSIIVTIILVVLFLFGVPMLTHKFILGMMKEKSDWGFKLLFVFAIIYGMVNNNILRGTGKAKITTTETLRTESTYMMLAIAAQSIIWFALFLYYGLGLMKNPQQDGDVTTGTAYVCAAFAYPIAMIAAVFIAQYTLRQSTPIPYYNDINEHKHMNFSTLTSA